MLIISNQHFRFLLNLVKTTAGCSCGYDLEHSDHKECNDFIAAQQNYYLSLLRSKVIVASQYRQNWQ